MSGCTVIRFAGRPFLRSGNTGKESVFQFLDGNLEGDMYLFRKNRQALKTALERYKGSKRKALLPSYIPDVAAEPFKLEGIEVDYYRINEGLGADLNDIENRIDQETDILLGVNYGGFANPELEELRQIADNNNLLFIEDNSQSSLSFHNSSLLGTYGDISINGFYKTMPIRAGSGLYINTDLGGFQHLNSRKPVIEATDLLDLKTQVLAAADYVFRWSQQEDHSENKMEVKQKVDTEVYRRERRLSHWGEMVMSLVNIKAVREKRRNNFTYWRERMKQKDRKPLYHLKNGVTPTYIFYLGAHDRIQSNVETLVSRIPPAILPEKVRENPEIYKKAHFMGRKLCMLPVHTGFDH